MALAVDDAPGVPSDMRSRGALDSDTDRFKLLKKTHVFPHE